MVVLALQGPTRPDPNRSCLQIVQRFLTAFSQPSLGDSAARPGGLVPARFRFLDRLSDLYGYMVVLALPRVQGIHRPRPDPNRSCLQIVQRFLTAFSQPSLGDFQQPGLAAGLRTAKEGWFRPGSGFWIVSLISTATWWSWRSPGSKGFTGRGRTQTAAACRLFRGFSQLSHSQVLGISSSQAWRPDSGPE